MPRRDERTSTSLTRALRRSRRAAAACGLAFAAAGFVPGGATSAHAWQFVDVTSAYGDRATAIVQPARNEPRVNLVVACEGDRWRSVVIGPPPGAGFPLDDGGKVRVSFSAEKGPKEQWQVRRRAKTRDVLYLAPVASELVRTMIGRADASPDAALYADVTSKGKGVTLEFPLAGLREAVRKDLWEPCKLGNQIPESEFDAKK